MDDERAWAPPSAPAGPASPEDLLPGYDQVELIARGGDSVVYRARQVALGRAVAIKVLDLDASGLDERARERFARELDVTVRLGRQHPHVVTVLDTGVTAAGHPAIVMELYDLGSLHDRLAAVGPLPVADVVAAGTVVADALDFAHQHGVLHRDVKPQNVLLLPTSYVLADFGIARQADSERTASVERFSYRHASPQVLDGVPPTAADDVWSLGSTLFTLLDGRPPFASDDRSEDSALQYLRRVRTGERRVLRRDDVPPALAAVVDRCLLTDPAQRYASAAEVREALEQVAAGLRAYLPGAGPVAAGPVAAQQVPEPEPEPEPEPVQEAEPEPAPVPPVAAPAVVSASALTHAAPSGAPEPDPDATGIGPVDTAPAAPPAAVTAPPEPDRSVRRRRLLLAGIAAALLIGVAAGFLVKQAASNQARQLPTPTPTTATSVPVIPSTEPVPSPTAPDFSDPELDPEATFVDDGAAVEVSWTDPTDGEALFLVLLKQPTGVWEPVAQLDPGSTSYTFTAFDPAAQDLCMTVTAILVDDPSVNGATPEFPVRGTCPADAAD